MAYMVWLGSVLTTISDQNVAAMRVARKLEICLIIRKSQYFGRSDSSCHKSRLGSCTGRRQVQGGSLL